MMAATNGFPRVKHKWCQPPADLRKSLQANKLQKIVQVAKMGSSRVLIVLSD